MRVAALSLLPLATFISLSMLVSCSGDDDSEASPTSEFVLPSTSSDEDFPGSKDFSGIARYPESTISAWSQDGQVIDCEGEGPVAAYKLWAVRYRMPPGAMAADVLQFYRTELSVDGWSASVSAPTYLHLVRGAATGDDRCNPDARQDHVDITMSPDDCSENCEYTVELLQPPEFNPY